MGTLTPVNNGNNSYAQYKLYNYNDGSPHNGIHVFTTYGKNFNSITPVVLSVKTDLAYFNPTSVSSGNIIAKINGNVFDSVSNNSLGFFYQGNGSLLYVNGESFTSASNIPNYSEMFQSWYYPCFCVKNDGTATIRWFPNNSSLATAIAACKCIIASYHALVFNGKNVFTENVYDNEAGSNNRLIALPVNSGGRYINDQGNPEGNAYRTLLGHKSGDNGMYILLATDCQITCRTAASLMLDLGCDYAVNLDGGPSTQMRVKDGYGPPVGKVTSSTGQSVFSAVCAYVI